MLFYSFFPPVCVKYVTYLHILYRVDSFSYRFKLKIQHNTSLPVAGRALKTIISPTLRLK